MSAIFMSRHRFSTINPDDIAKVGQQLGLNSVTFKPIDEYDDDSEDEKGGQPGDEENGFLSAAERRRRSTRGSLKKRTRLRRLRLKWSRLSQKYGFNHVVPIILLVLYSIVGALIFSSVELPRADERNEEMVSKLEENRKWVANSVMRELNVQNDSQNYRRILEILKQSDVNNRLPTPEPITWDIWGSLFYVGTIYTTIGYGNIHPDTKLGYALTIVYAFFGVPLVLAILSDIGQLLARWLSKVWQRLQAHIPKTQKEKKENTDFLLPESGIPVSLCLVLTFSWLLMCSALFCIWEDWSYFTAFYFFFISLSTIGLGDVVPDEPKLMIFNFGFVLIGLCLVSMTLGVVQEHIALFLYRMMIEMQKECEAMLANGEDVEKKELMDKIWEKKPWYLKKFMPSFISKGQNQRLQDFAGATITDTAVNLGIIPPPPGYRPGLAQLAAVASCVPGMPLAAAAGISSATLMSGEPKAATVSEPLKGATSSLLAPMLAAVGQPGLSALCPRKSATTIQELYPGGHAVVRRSNSCRLTPEQVANRKALGQGTWPRGQDRTLGTSEASKQKKKKHESITFNTVVTQTDIQLPDFLDIGVKRDTVSTLSLASWYEEDECMPFSMRQLDKLTAQEMKHLPNVAKLLPVGAYKRPEPKSIEAAVQTDSVLDSESVSSSSDDFVSAMESKPFIPPQPLSASKSVQTVPVDGVSQSCVEVQTDTLNCFNAEVQTSSATCTNAEVQCQPEAMQDEEMQTSFSEQSQLQSRPDLLPSSSQQYLDEWTQTTSMESISVDVQTDHGTTNAVDVQTDLATTNAVETQTNLAATNAVETQTDITSTNIVETQTDESRLLSDLSRRTSTPGGTGKRLQIRLPNDDDQADVKKEFVVDATGNKAPGWVYSAWVSNPDEENSLPSVAEDEGSSDMDEEMDSDLEDTDLSVSDEEPEVSEGIDLPGVTTQFSYEQEPEAVGDEETRRRSSRQSRHTSSGIGVITASIPTQTEEIVTRRQSFPRDVFTSRPKIIVVENEPEKEKKGHGLFGWLTHKRRHTKSNIETRERVTSGKVQDVAIQTDSSPAAVRDILIQTDDSFLMKAKKFEKLRQNRTKSLAVAVAPHLKQRLSKMAAKAHGTTVVVEEQEEGSKGKKPTTGKRK